MMAIALEIKVMSPIHLTSGQADVNVDSEVIHDQYGMPYFPAKRFKGILYESALEVTEMAERSGKAILTKEQLEKLFHHTSDNGGAQLIIHNLHLKKEDEYQKLCEAWAALQEKYKSLLAPEDVLQEYTSVRYQTQLKDGVAADGSLRNIRVVNAGVTFYGEMELIGENAEDFIALLALALRNLHAAGLNRNRGFGRIRCTMRLPDNRTEEEIIEEIFRKEGM